MKYWYIAVFAVSFSFPLEAQFSGYFSLAGAYDSNPLCNYQNLSDWLVRPYALAGYTTAGSTTSLRTLYEGGAALFFRLHQRTYLDHSVRIRFAYRPGSDTFDTPSDEERDNEEEETGSQTDSSDEDQEPLDPDADTLGGIWEFGLGAGARHDYDAYADFDNYGGEASAGYSLMPFGSSRLRLTSRLTYRKYPNVEELSNWTENIVVRLESGTTTAFTWGVESTAGWKMYAKSRYDTARYETKKSYTYAPGKGKLGGIVKIPSNKVVLLDASAKTSMQMTASVDARYTHGSFNSQLTLRYRFNPVRGSRTLVQNASAGLLTDDLYNEYFSHEGFEGSLHSEFRTGGMTVAVSAETTQKNFWIPAMNLAGEETANKRRDVSINLGLQISRPLALWNTNLDLSCSIGYIRNLSNDMYNDFSAAQASLGVGYGF